MIIPIGHEHTTVRRLPWVTFTILGLCVLAFGLTVATIPSDLGPSEEKVEEFVEYFFDHPYVNISHDQRRALQEILAPIGLSRDLDATVEVRREAIDPPESDEQRRIEQEEFDHLFAELRGTTPENPFMKWGLVPNDIRLHTIITYQFMHGGVMHLLGNMLFLYLAAPFIEDRWGRPLFAAFYLSAGIFSALLYAARYPDLGVPLVGASGAIAGLMGAFLVLFWRSKIKFFYWLFAVFVGTFDAPAWLMLPLWFLRELVYAQAFDAIDPEGGGSGVAFWAHIWGFIFGAVVAVLMTRFRVEEKYLDKAIEEKITLVNNTVVEEALQARTEGRIDDAMNLLRRELAENPQNLDAAVAFWNLAKTQQATGEAAPHLLRLITNGVRTGDAELVAAHWPELLETEPEAVNDCALSVRVAELFYNADLIGLARDAVAVALASADVQTPPGLLAKLIRQAGAQEVAVPQSFLEIAAAHPDLPPEAREGIEGLRIAPDISPEAVSEPAAPAEGRAEVEPIAPATVPAHTLRIMEAVPRAVSDASLSLTVSGNARRLDLDDVQAIGVAGIAEQGSKPFLVVDLLLDPVWSEQPSLRVVRLVSTAFDPRKVVGGTDSMAAFRSLIDSLLRISEAVPLPDPDGARGHPFRSFSSLAAYEHEVLGVG